MKNDPVIETIYNLAPVVIPKERAQNIKIMSMGSLTAVLNLTILNAPTIPNDKTRLELIVIIMVQVISEIRTNATLKL